MKLLAILFLLTSCLGSYSATGQVLTSSINLREYGLKTRKELRNIEYEGAETTHLAIDSRGLLYVGFPSQNPAGSSQNGLGTGDFRVLGIGADGKIARRLDYPMRSPYRVGINLNASDQLLVTSDNTLRLVDADGYVKSSFALAVYEHDTTAAWRVSSSSSRQTIMTSPDGFREFTFLSGTDLSILAHCTGSRREDVPNSFNDTTEVATSGGVEHDIYLARLCGKTQRSPHSDRTFVVPVLLTNGSLLEFGDSMLRLRAASGEFLWTVNLPENHRVWLNLQNEEAALTRKNNRVAIMVGEWSGGIAALDISRKLKSQTIQVYEVSSGKLVATVPVKKPGSEFVLNQDGTEVAILFDTSLEIWTF